MGGGVLAFLIACASYRFVERPIRRWKRSSGALQHPGRIFLVGLAANPPVRYRWW
jgi:peptidoglycan/LPS O-acetylase OafA/YrhL